MICKWLHKHAKWVFPRFGTRRSVVRIHSPRPNFSITCSLGTPLKKLPVDEFVDWGSPARISENAPGRHCGSNHRTEHPWSPFSEKSFEIAQLQPVEQNVATALGHLKPYTDLLTVVEKRKIPVREIPDTLE